MVTVTNWEYQNKWVSKNKPILEFHFGHYLLVFVVVVFHLVIELVCLMAHILPPLYSQSKNVTIHQLFVLMLLLPFKNVTFDNVLKSPLLWIALGMNQLADWQVCSCQISSNFDLSNSKIFFLFFIRSSQATLDK